MDLSSLVLRELAARFLEEDVGYGDITTLATVPPQARGHGRFLAKEALVLAGLEVALAVFHTVDNTISLDCAMQDGVHLTPGSVIAEIHGPARALLTAERVALNLLQRLSGVATATRRYVESVRHTGVRIIDTRKTTPGLRRLERQAVRDGGAHNHRDDLGAAVLIKDNHIVAGGGIRQAVERARAHAPHTSRIEVEVESLEALDEALDAGAQIVMLDNFAPDQIGEAVRRAAGKALVEVSGGITLDRIEALARAGVDVASVGGLTHSAPAADIGLDIERIG